MAESEKMMPREAGKYIATHSKDVTISEEGVKKTAELVRITTNLIFKKIFILYLTLFRIIFYKSQRSYLLSWNNLIFLKICKWCYCFEWVLNQSFSVKWQLSFTDSITSHHNTGNVYKHWVFKQFARIYFSSTSTTNNPKRKKNEIPRKTLIFKLRKLKLNKFIGMNGQI